MLIFGPYQACAAASQINREHVMFNFTSLVQSIPRLGFLLPNLDVRAIDPLMISAHYSEYVLTSPNAFGELMSIMIPLYEGKYVYVCTSGETINNYITVMNELLSELIKTRYGYQAVFINTAEDLDYFDESDFKFSVTGIMNFDRDRDNLVMGNESARLSAGGKPYGTEFDRKYYDEHKHII